MKRAVVISNTRSGSGKAGACAPGIIETLTKAGVQVTHIPVGPGLTGPSVAHATQGADALIVIGGDGTVRSAAAAAIAAHTPIYHIPCGNENLFAREFAMDANPNTLLNALQRRKVVMMDIGEANWERGPQMPFLLMASLGPDASVIHRLHTTRSKATGHAAYLKPILDELRDPALPRLTVQVDGRTVVDNRRGVLVMANCGQYAFRIDPCQGASVTDGVFDVCFMPAESAVDVLAWFARARLRRHRGAGVVCVQGRDIRVLSMAGAAPLQIDGEAIPPGGPGTALEVRILPGVLPVLDAR